MTKPSATQRDQFEFDASPHLPAMYSLALRLTRSPDDAQDLVQDTLVRAFRYFEQFESGSNFKAWLLRIERNLFINNYRRAVRERDVLSGPASMAVGDGVMSRSTMRALTQPVSDAQRVLIGEEIERAFAQLPDDARTVVLLSDVDDMSYREIADVLGCPIGTVMSRLHRARRMLRSLLFVQAVELGIIDTDRSDEQEIDAPTSLAAYRTRKEHSA